MNPYPAINLVLVMDNARIHKGGRIARLCQDAGVRLIYLPPYFPELNLIEMCFSQVKSNLRQTQALVSNPDPIWTIRLTVHDVVSPALLHELYCNCGYDCPPDSCDSSSSDSVIMST